MAKTVKITAGQSFTVFVPLVMLNADGTKEAVQADTLTNVGVKAQNSENRYDVPYNTYEHYLVLEAAKDLLPVGVYDLIITATLPSGREFRLAMQEAIGAMSWDWQTNWRDYLVGGHIELCDQPFIAGEFVTDAELERLKAELRAAIADAEHAKAEAIAEKEHYAEAVEQLDDYAKQGANPNATLSAILEELQGSGTPSPDIPESVAERLAMILEHFGIKTISGYSFGTPTEIIDELKDIMGAIDQEATLPNSVTIDGTTYSGTSNS